MQTIWKNVEDMSLPFLLKYFENGPDNLCKQYSTRVKKRIRRSWYGNGSLHLAVPSGPCSRRWTSSAASPSLWAGDTLESDGLCVPETYILLATGSPSRYMNSNLESGNKRYMSAMQIIATDVIFTWYDMMSRFTGLHISRMALTINLSSASDSNTFSFK